MTRFPDTRETLLLQLRTDESGAWMEFLRLYETVIYRVATKAGLQHADALDVTQDVLVKVYRKIGEWNTGRTDGRFRSWLHRITMNASIDVIRRRTRQATASGDSEIQQLLVQHPAASEGEATWFALEHRRTVFMHVAEKLRVVTSEVAWQAFWRTSIDGIPARDVARELQLSVGSVYTHKCRVLASIRAGVEELTGETSYQRGKQT